MCSCSLWHISWIQMWLLYNWLILLEETFYALSICETKDPLPFICVQIMKAVNQTRYYEYKYWKRQFLVLKWCSDLERVVCGIGAQSHGMYTEHSYQKKRTKSTFPVWMQQFFAAFLFRRWRTDKLVSNLVVCMVVYADVSWDSGSVFFLNSVFFITSDPDNRELSQLESWLLSW